MSSAMTTQRATLIGLLAPLCWGMGVSLVRGIAEGFGLAQGQTLLYTTAAVCLFFVIGIPDLRTVDRRYLIFGLPTANASSLCFTLSIFFSAGGTQTMEAAGQELSLCLLRHGRRRLRPYHRRYEGSSQPVH